VKTSEVLQAWACILSGRTPSLSIELTRECPLRCSGCYAYEDAHLGTPGVNLRVLSDYKGDVLVQNTLRLVDEHRHCMFPLSEEIPWFVFANSTICCPSWSGVVSMCSL